jgi:hypothetical protein
MDHPLSPFDVYMSPGIDQERYHWCSGTQDFAPAHILLQYLIDGWQPNPLVLVRRFALTEHRYADVYTFMLHKHEEKLILPVLVNPIVSRVIVEYDLHLHRRLAATREGRRH